MYNSKIIGMGKYVPENVVTNEDLTSIMDTSHEWIVERTWNSSRSRNPSIVTHINPSGGCFWFFIRFTV